MRFTLKQTRLGLRNSTTRLPFRYGKACLTRCPQAILEATIECAAGVFRGWSGDCLPPGWFDKKPDLSYRQQIDDMLAVIDWAQRKFAEEASGRTTLFDAWLAVHHRVLSLTPQLGYTPLLSSFGVSLVERAILDALARAGGMTFGQAVRENIYEIRPGDVHAELADWEPKDWLPRTPRTSVFVRHTVGLSDRLTTASLEALPRESQSSMSAERVDDAFPQALAEYIDRCGLSYFKVKVANRAEVDKQRLLEFAAVVEERLGDDYRLTLDGNEQFRSMGDFEEFFAALCTTPKLQTLCKNILAVEQPLERSVALDEDQAAAIRRVGRRVPVIIDESDGTLSAYAQALDVGYRGVSSKNCKGAIKSLLNSGLTWLRNDRDANSDHLMTGEDLCCVGVVPVQADLCLAATLGLTHIERNGHHYHPGISYLPHEQQTAALAAHGDFYADQHGRIAPAVKDGKFEIATIVNCVGFGFAALPDMTAFVPAEEWRYESLGLG